MIEIPYEFMRPLVTGWLEKINQGIRRKKEWQETADQCMAFFSGSVGFMWEEKYRKKFIGGSISPKFRLSLNKAFELVALYAPTLYHDNPVRTVRPYKPIDYPPEVVAQALGVSPDQYQAWAQASQQAEQFLAQGQPLPPEIVQGAVLYERISQEITRLLGIDRAEKASVNTACQLMERYLSYTPREQPNGGLRQAAEDGITEFLIKGRGLLFPRPYQMPGSDRILTGCFWESADRLVTDPDAESLAFGDTQWMALEHVQPWWEVEKRFKLPHGVLRKAGKLESAESQAAADAGLYTNLDRQRRLSRDLIRWWEVWSIAGTGTQMAGFSDVMDSHFAEVVGDYAYVCVCEGVPWPLNAPVDQMRDASDDDVAEMFSWPVPFYLDQRWPCTALEVYREPRNPYPVAPLKPGLGELTFLNVVISHLCNRIWTSSRTLLAVLESARAYVETQLKGGEDLCVIGLKEIHQDINKVVREFKFQDLNYDIWRIVEQVFELFDKRVGLSDLYYGLNPGGVASRSATDVQAKQEKLSIRPDHMSRRVDDWMSEAARMEKLCAFWSGVGGRDVRPMLGTVGSMLWDQLIVQADPETVLREMDATVEAGTAKRPNKERDAANMAQLYQPLAQGLTGYAQATGDTGPLNELHRKVGDSIDQDMSGLEMGPWTPPPPPPGTPNPVEIEAQKAQAELEAKQAESQLRQQEGVQRLRQQEAEHRQKLRHKQEEHHQKIQLQKVQARMKRLQTNRPTRQHDPNQQAARDSDYAPL